AILHERLLDFLAHFMGMRSAKNRHLAIPPRAEVSAKVLEPEKLTQREKMLGKTRARVVHFRLLKELAPGLVCEQCERAQLAAALKMGDDFVDNAFLLFDRGISGNFRAVLDE